MPFHAHSLFALWLITSQWVAEAVTCEGYRHRSNRGRPAGNHLPRPGSANTLCGVLQGKATPLGAAPARTLPETHARRAHSHARGGHGMHYFITRSV